MKDTSKFECHPNADALFHFNVSRGTVEFKSLLKKERAANATIHGSGGFWGIGVPKDDQNVLMLQLS
ncbi:MAG TPA: hypothetical protein VFW05_19150 [Verrucomicrobiae bacterium]|jgi:hypothetical protein|nr:hypothetical protein [Verrucomicrobiae bacterium]